MKLSTSATEVPLSNKTRLGALSKVTCRPQLSMVSGYFVAAAVAGAGALVGSCRMPGAPCAAQPVARPSTANTTTTRGRMRNDMVQQSRGDARKFRLVQSKVRQ
jgi:hypothetical protein